MSRNEGNLSNSTASGAEISLENLQALSFELINKSVTLWRTYRDTAKSKGLKIHLATRIHEMVIQAMRFHPDLKHLQELEATVEEVEREIAVARKVHSVTTGTAGAQ